MKKLIVLLIVFLWMASPAIQASLTLSNVSGTWVSVTQDAGGDTVYDTLVSGYGNTVENRFMSGTSDGRSGLSFTGAVPPSATFEIGDAFEIGQLKHYNQPTYAGSPTAADLSIALSFSDPMGLSGMFGFNFQINNTPNNTGMSPWDDDIVYFPSSYPSQAFNVGGEFYTLQLLGFGNTPSSLISEFSSPEGGTNATLLWGRITTAPPTIPAPGAILLAGMGMGLVGWMRRRRTL